MSGEVQPSGSIRPEGAGGTGNVPAPFRPICDPKNRIRVDGNKIILCLPSGTNANQASAAAATISSKLQPKLAPGITVKYHLTVNEDTGQAEIIFFFHNTKNEDVPPKLRNRGDARSMIQSIATNELGTISYTNGVCSITIPEGGNAYGAVKRAQGLTENSFNYSYDIKPDPNNKNRWIIRATLPQTGNAEGIH